jgi:methenyltetrahydrofolate cyclohydrolase
MSLSDRSVRDLLAAFSDSQPTPGGGSASALASAVGASLLLMVAALPKTRSGAAEERVALDAAAGALSDLQRQLADAVDADAAAYDRVVAAFKLPKATEAEQAARRSAIQDATAGATQIPLSVMRLSVSALDQAAAVARHGNRSAASDVGVAIALLAAGLRGARLNVEVNLAGLKDASLAGAIRSEMTRLDEEGGRAAARGNHALEDRQA